MRAKKTKKENATGQRRHLVQATAAKMRALILAREPDTQIGALSEMARTLGVGIVTVQQVARILEHEGLLRVRRGPGGGYYGTRPDEAALERTIAAYVRVHGSGHREAIEVVSILACEIVPEAARCTDAHLREAIAALDARVDKCDTMAERIALEEEEYQLFTKMVKRPLIQLLIRVAIQLHERSSLEQLYPGAEGINAWKSAKHRLLRAILDQDEELARFEAGRASEERLARLRAQDAS